MKKLKQLRERINNNIFVKIGKAFLYILVVMLLVVIIVQKVSNNTISVGGVRVFMVVSESMKDEYNIGDILISKHVNEDEINVGDNVTYLGEKSNLKGLIITHKVIKRDEREGKVYFVTKGIANVAEDPEITYDQIYGKVVYRTVFLSLIAKLMNNQLSYYLLFIIVGVIISIDIVSAMFDSDDEEEEEDERRE